MPTSRGTAWLALENGAVYPGRLFGAPREIFGEVVFNTGTTGYVEVLTDPSYHGQIVVMTQPHIGNYGVQSEDFECDRVRASGFVVHDLTARPRHGESKQNVDALLRRFKIPGVAGLPTREITLLLREKGSMRGMIATKKAPVSEWLRRIKRSPTLKGRALAGEVSTPKAYVYRGGAWEGRRKIAVLDFGVKRSMLDVLADQGCAVKVFPAATPAAEVLESAPDAVLLSNGPGDPAPLKAAAKQVRVLMDANIPMMGICLGHQLMALALGARAAKLKFGHHGINHPVRDVKSGRILITTQNHCFSIREGGLPRDYEVTHLSLNDGTIEGFRHKKKPIVAYQFHPEAGPGPTETRDLLREFLDEI